MIEIYKVTNKINGKLYIGQTSRTLEKRRSAHIRNSFNANAPDYDCAFHKAIRKHGPENFTWEIVNTCTTVSESNELEKELIAKYNTCHGIGYNSNEGGGSGLGFKHSEEAKVKIRKAIVDRGNGALLDWIKNNPDQVKQKCKNAKRKPFTKEQLEEYSQRAKDKELWKFGSTSEAIEKRQATRETNGGYDSVSKRQKENNVSHRPEVQQKISDSVKKLWEDPEYRANQLAKREQANPVVKCPHCEKEGRNTIMQRHHFNRCKFKK